MAMMQVMVPPVAASWSERPEVAALPAAGPAEARARGAAAARCAAGGAGGGGAA